MRYAEVIGDPIAHSRSPDIHGHWLKALGISAEYRRTRVEASELERFIETRRNDPDWCGCNVTLPHKLAAAQLADVCGEEVSIIGAANLLYRENGRLTARNMDAEGFLRPLAEIDLKGAQAVIIGAGGAARAILFALGEKGVEHVTILNRTRETAEALLADLGIEGSVFPLNAMLPSADIVVNTSALGMTGQPPLALDLTPLPSTAIVYDIVYTPLETDVLAAARRQGLHAIDGLGMFIGQAAASFPLFFGKPAPADDEGLRALLTS